MEEEYELVMSPLCQTVTQDGYTATVHIYGDGKSDWILEVEDEQGGSTVWDDPFATDKLALEGFRRTLDSEGIRYFQVSDD